MPSGKSTSELQQAQKELTAFHDAYIKTWNDSLKAQRTYRLVEKVSDRFVGYFAHGDSKAPDVLDAISYRQSLKTAVQQLGPRGLWRIQSRRVTMRSPREGIVFCRYTLHQGKSVANEWTMEIWRKEEGKWKLIRIYEEVL